MSLQQRIEGDYKQAFKANDRAVVSALRMLKSSIKNREIEVGRELTDEETTEMVGREVKRRREAQAHYVKGGREDLAMQEANDVAVYQRYLPEQMTEAELNQVIAETVASLQAQGPKDFGKVMAAVMAAVKGRADGRAVQASVKQALGA